MPTNVIKICSRCERKTCDGGLWRKTKIVQIHDGKDVTEGTPEENMVSCTMSLFGKKPEFKHLYNTEIGTGITRDYFNWVKPCRVTLIKIEE